MSGAKQRLLCAAIAFILGLLITGCAPKVKLVSVPCIDAKDVPAEPESVRPRLTGNAASDVLVLADGLLAWKAYGLRLHGLTAGCVG